MNKFMKNSGIFLLLVVYCIIVYAGSCFNFQLLFFSASKSGTLKIAKIDDSPPKRESLTQKSDIPAIPKLDSKPPAVISSFHFPETSQWQSFHYLQPSPLLCLFAYYRFLPRDPPSA